MLRQGLLRDPVERDVHLGFENDPLQFDGDVDRASSLQRIQQVFDQFAKFDLGELRWSELEQQLSHLRRVLHASTVAVDRCVGADRSPPATSFISDSALSAAVHSDWLTASCRSLARRWRSSAAASSRHALGETGVREHGGRLVGDRAEALGVVGRVEARRGALDDQVADELIGDSHPGTQRAAGRAE